MRVPGLAFLSGTSFGWLRFHITVIPLTVLLAGHLIAALPRPAGAERDSRRTTAVTVGVLAMVLVAIPSTLVTLNRPTLAREESEWFTADGAARTRGLTRVNRQVAADLDTLALPGGTLLTGWSTR